MAIGRHEDEADKLEQLVSDVVKVGAVGIVHKLDAAAEKVPGIVHARVFVPRLGEGCCMMKSAGRGEALPRRK